MGTLVEEAVHVLFQYTPATENSPPATFYIMRVTQTDSPADKPAPRNSTPVARNTTPAA